VIRVSHIIANRPQPYLLDAGMSVSEASYFLQKHHIGAAPVAKEGQLVGFCSERDIVYRVVAEERNPDETRVEEIMSTDVLYASPRDTVVQCETMMRQRHVRHLPIVENGRVVACISLRNLLRTELSEYKLEVEVLTEYIRGA